MSDVAEINTRFLNLATEASSGDKLFDISRTLAEHEIDPAVLSSKIRQEFGVSWECAANDQLIEVNLHVVAAVLRAEEGLA